MALYTALFYNSLRMALYTALFYNSLRMALYTALFYNSLRMALYSALFYNSLKLARQCKKCRVLITVGIVLYQVNLLVYIDCKNIKCMNNT
jgi:hypothetical protein